MPFPRLFSRKRLSTVLLLCVAISVLIYVMQRPGFTVSDETLEVNGLSRAYRLVFPQSHSNDQRLPLVVAFHGALDRTDEMAGYTGLDELSAEKRFLRVYPEGRHQNWPPLIPEENPHIMQPDVAFFRALCDHMVTHRRADPDRIYASRRVPCRANHGHGWPLEHNINEVAWSFFSKHVRQRTAD